MPKSDFNSDEVTGLVYPSDKKPVVAKPKYNFEIFQTLNVRTLKKNKEWCWRVKHINGNEICRASETYKNKKDAVKAFLNFYQTKNIQFTIQTKTK